MKEEGIWLSSKNFHLQSFRYRLIVYRMTDSAGCSNPQDPQWLRMYTLQGTSIYPTLNSTHHSVKEKHRTVKETQGRLYRKPYINWGYTDYPLNKVHHSDDTILWGKVPCPESVFYFCTQTEPCRKLPWLILGEELGYVYFCYDALCRLLVAVRRETGLCKLMKCVSFL
jgi:hypothetical protein